ncbi:hypothetical protein GCM10007377_11270 [Galliscardovia ingluviei]|uniref:Acyltransferase 3 domain-containing protein n=1 Tax=Galliscardovia ingluviei TaxID=1769422 RepID=A0A8J3AKJ9_9BIFI|nr:acyltransferase [Galliscardovia ingluviei]GGI14505.1 hypothetical protein GCM10007377_11270 [Galliscardovia ingluviei]
MANNLTNICSNSSDTASSMRYGTRASQKPVRNSRVEALRILAMFLIVAHHAVYFSAVDPLTGLAISNSTSNYLLKQPLSISKVLLETFFYSGGKIGVVVFFMISAWYLREESSIKQCFKRVWILEREVLWYSLGLLLLSIGAAASKIAIPGLPVVAENEINLKLIVGSVFPTLTGFHGLWWYVTAYAMFLLLFPFIVRGLRALSKRQHAILAMLCLVMWSGFAGFIPIMKLGMLGGTFLSFIYLYMLMSFYKWHMKPIRVRTAWLTIAGSYTVLLLAAAAGGAIYEQTGKLAQAQVFLAAAETRIIPILIGFSAVIVATQRTANIPWINRLASTMFAVYLITQYPPVLTALWTYTGIGLVESRTWAIGYIALCVVLIMAVCVCMDLLRQLVFACVIDRRGGSGGWFEKLWERINKRVVEVKSITKLSNELK